MLRGAAKSALLAAFGRSAKGVAAYRTLTRDWMGTQATHVDKLARVWPGYSEVWKSLAGLELDGTRVWIHEGGWTPFPFLANHLLTGDAGFVTNAESRMLDRYLGRAVNGALASRLPSTSQTRARREQIDVVRWYDHVHDAIVDLGGALHERVDVTELPLESHSVDLAHSGGTLEHVTPDELDGFISETFRIVRPGGVVSHVLDHRDHLHHADPGWPFLWHLRLSERAYRALFGHPLLYHNRLMPTEIMQRFESAGFERLAVRRLILPDRVYVDGEAACDAGRPGIERAALAAEFRSVSDADLRTAAAHYLYRKPG